MAEPDTKTRSLVEFTQGNKANTVRKLLMGICLREKYLEDFAVDKTVQELTVHSRFKANYKQAKKREQYLEKEFSHTKSGADFISRKDEDSPRKQKLRKKLDRVSKQNMQFK